MQSLEVEQKVQKLEFVLLLLLNMLRKSQAISDIEIGILEMMLSENAKKNN